MAEARLGVSDHLRLVGFGPARREEVANHVVNRILEPACGLDRCPSAQIHDPLGQGRRAPCPRGSLGHQHLGADLPGSMRRVAARGTESGHEDVRFQVE